MVNCLLSNLLLQEFPFLKRNLNTTQIGSLQHLCRLLAGNADKALSEQEAKKDQGRRELEVLKSEVSGVERSSEPPRWSPHV